MEKLFCASYFWAAEKKSQFQVVIQWRKHNNKGETKTETASYHSSIDLAHDIIQNFSRDSGGGPQV